MLNTRNDFFEGCSSGINAVYAHLCQFVDILKGNDPSDYDPHIVQILLFHTFKQFFTDRHVGT